MTLQDCQRMHLPEQKRNLNYSSWIFSKHLHISDSWGKVGDGPLFCQAQQTGEGSFGFRSSPGAESKVCWSFGWPGRFGAEQQGSWFHQKWSAAPVTGLHYRPQQPYGAQPPGQSLLLQKGVVTVIKAHGWTTLWFDCYSHQCVFLITLRITVKCSIWPSTPSITLRSRPCRLKAATS